MAFSKTTTFTIELTDSEADKMRRSSDDKGDAKAWANWSEAKKHVTVEVKIESLPKKKKKKGSDAQGHDYNDSQSAQQQASRRTHRPTHLPILP